MVLHEPARSRRKAGLGDEGVVIAGAVGAREWVGERAARSRSSRLEPVKRPESFVAAYAALLTPR